MKGEIATRYREFEIPGTAQVVEGNGGLPKVRITTLDVIGEIYLHRAHITSWKPYGEEEVLFLSNSPDGRTTTQFAEAYPSVSLGLEARQTIPKRRRTASSARSHGIWNRFRKLEMWSP